MNEETAEKQNWMVVGISLITSYLIIYDIVFALVYF